MKSKKSSGTRKYGRNLDKCKRYSMAKKHEKSHLKRIEKHILAYSDESPMVKNALKKYRSLLNQER